MSRLYNLARMHAATLGTGSLIDLGNAVTGFLTFASAGVTDGITVSYAINDPVGGGSEVGSGVYHSSGPSFTRTTVEKSSSGTSRISLSASAEIMITPSAADLNKLYGIPDSSTDNAIVRCDGTTFGLQDSAVILGDAGSAMSPATSDNMALGTAAKMWADLFLASGGEINWNNGGVKIREASDVLVFEGAASGYTFDAFSTITSADASALAVGRQGATDPVLKVNAATASVATGIAITGAAAASRASLAAISSGTNEGLSIDAKGSGTIRLGATSTGAVEFSRNAVPTASDGAALGTATLPWSDAHLALGGILNWNNSNATGTHAADSLTWAIASQNILEFAKNAAGSGTYLRLLPGNSAGFQNCEFDVVSDISAAGVSFRMKGDWPFVIHAPSDQSASAKMALYEQESNGTNRMVWQAAASIASDFTLVWPGGVPGANNTPLVCSTGGVLSFNTTPYLGTATGDTMVYATDRAVRFNNQTSSAAAQVGTLTNAPAAGNPGFWLKINVGGTNYAVPCWAG